MVAIRGPGSCGGGTAGHKTANMLVIYLLGFHLRGWVSAPVGPRGGRTLQFGVPLGPPRSNLVRRAQMILLGQTCNH